MFGFLKSKKSDKPAVSVEEIAEELMSQILTARDEAKQGGIIDEQVFNERLNHMYVAGYLIGYVDNYLTSLFEEDADKKEKSREIFEKMFPGTGFDFIRANLLARQQAASVSQEEEDYKRIAAAAHVFDVGMAAAQAEVESYQQKGGQQPCGLKDFLLLGEIKVQRQKTGDG